MPLTRLPTISVLSGTARRCLCRGSSPPLRFVGSRLVIAVFAGVAAIASATSPAGTDSLVGQGAGATLQLDQDGGPALTTAVHPDRGAPTALPQSLEQTVYDCDSGATLLAGYDGEADLMWVRYQDEVQSLASVISASGAKFGGHDVPWGFWSKGDEGFVFAYEPDGSEGDIRDQCWVSEASTEGAEGLDDGRRWSLELQSDYIVLLDCMDCGDDIGAVIECRERGEPARLSIFWAAVDTEEPLTASLTLEVAGEIFERPAETSYAGQIGRFPQIRVGPEDPLLSALRADDEMKVTFAGIETRIGLRGFAAALQAFDDACPWRPEDALQPDEGADGAAANAEEHPPSPEPSWLLSGADDADGAISTASLSYGIAETDAVAFLASCAGPDRKGSVDLVAVVDVGDRIEHEAVDLVVTADGLELRLAGEVSTGQTTYPGVRAQVGHRHPLWAVLQMDGPVSLRAADGPAVTVSSAGLSGYGHIEKFLDICANER